MRANRLLLRTGRGWATVENTDGNLLIIEGLIGHGTQPSEQESQRVGFARLETYAQERVQKTVGIEPQDIADTPLHGYFVGDTVELDGGPERIVSIGGSRDDTGAITWLPQLGEALKTEEESQANAIKKMSEGTFRGDADEATPLDMISRKGNPADPVLASGTHVCRIRCDNAIIGPGANNNATWPTFSIDSQSGGFSLASTGLLVVPVGGWWDVHAIINGTATGVSFAGYMSTSIQTYNLAGSFNDACFENRSQWENLPGGPTGWSTTSMPVIVPAAGGQIGVNVFNSNSGTLSAEMQMGVHYIGPGGYEVGLPA